MHTMDMISIHPLIKEKPAKLDEYPEILILPLESDFIIESFGDFSMLSWMSFEAEYKLFIGEGEYNIHYS